MKVEGRERGGGEAESFLLCACKMDKEVSKQRHAGLRSAAQREGKSGNAKDRPHETILLWWHSHKFDAGSDNLERH